MQINEATEVQFLELRVKVIKRRYYPSSHHLNVIVLLNNITFYDVCGFRCASHCLLLLALYIA